MSHTIEQTDILCFFTNVPCPRLQKKVKIASTQGKVTLVYWKRPGTVYNIGLSQKALLIPIEASFMNNRGLFRFLVFFIFLLKAWPILRRARQVRKVYVDYLDVLFFTCLIFWNSRVELIYEVGDLISLQYGGHPFITGTVSRLERLLLKRVSTLILPSPFFLSEYYRHIHKGSWMLIENLPESRTWQHFRRSQDNGECVVGFIGSIRYRKPIECLLTASNELRGSGYNVSVFFAGTGPEEKEIRQLASGLEFVSFHGAYEYDKDAVQLYAQVSIVFSVYDTRIKNVKIALPNRFYESIICGLPIIVAKGTQLESYMRKYDSGYSIDCTSVKECKEVLKSQLIGDSEALRIKRSLNAIDKSQFFYDRYYDELLSLFDIRGVTKHNKTR
jgi:succinoglycan biosynthesis protein ExoL